MDWITLGIGIIKALPGALWYALLHPLATIGLISDSRRRGVVRVLIQEEADSMISSIAERLAHAKESITLLAYAPTSLLTFQYSLVNKANSGVTVTVIIPDPRNSSLIEQIANFAESRTAHFARVKASLETLKICWRSVSDGRRFQVLVTNAIPMFVALVIDDRIATVTLWAQHWPLQKRPFFYLQGGDLLDFVRKTCVEVVQEEFHSTEVNSEELFEELITAAAALK